MFEFWFTFTAAYLAYVGYEAHQAVQRAERGGPMFKSKPSAAARTEATPVAHPAPAIQPEPVPTPGEAEPAPVVNPSPMPPIPAPVAKAAPPDESATLADELRNPATGELTAAPANYRFAKKWIKEALVQEKLLDRIYKPNELDDATSRKVKDAIDKLRAMKKYQA